MTSEERKENREFAKILTRKNKVFYSLKFANAHGRLLGVLR